MPSESPLDLLYEDPHLLILNKPEGLIVHAGHGVEHQETLAKILEDFYINTSEDWPVELLEERRRGIVHRLDKGTSGALICAKTVEAHQALAQMIKNREVHRYYYGICSANPAELRVKRPKQLNHLLQTGVAALKFENKTINLATYHARNPKKPISFYPPQEPGKRKAITQLSILSHNPKNFSLVEFKLLTGRTHQIRMHMQLCQCPLVGDSLYGGPKNERLYLHAHRIAFQHPLSDQKIDVSAQSESFRNFCQEHSLELPFHRGL